MTHSQRLAQDMNNSPLATPRPPSLLFAPGHQHAGPHSSLCNACFCADACDHRSDNKAERTWTRRRTFNMRRKRFLTTCIYKHRIRTRTHIPIRNTPPPQTTNKKQKGRFSLQRHLPSRTCGADGEKEGARAMRGWQGHFHKLGPLWQVPRTAACPWNRKVSPSVTSHN